MTQERINAIVTAYEDAFGNEQFETLWWPNWRGNVRFFEALDAAVKAGEPLTVERATVLLGEEPFREEVR